MKYVIIIGAGLGAVMLFLMAVVGYLLWRLRGRLKAGVFGTPGRLPTTERVHFPE